MEPLPDADGARRDRDPGRVAGGVPRTAGGRRYGDGRTRATRRTKRFARRGPEKLHCELDAALWVTVAVCPPIVSAAVRAPPPLAATVKATEPLPMPLAPLPMVSQGAPLVAVQAHSAVVVTVTGAPAPPPALTVCDGGVNANVQAIGAASCEMLIALPAIVTEPVRATPVFAATAMVTGAGPRSCRAGRSR